jgi:hypothetical protein
LFGSVCYDEAGYDHNWDLCNMARMIDLIRASALPSNLMQAGAKGSLSVPAGEMIEILVYLANHNKVFAEQAKLTLAGWDEALSRAAAADPHTPKEVLDYMISVQNLRPPLLPALLDNPALGEGSLIELAATGPREAVEAMLNSGRVSRSAEILHSLSSNSNVSGTQSARIETQLASIASKVSIPAAETPATVPPIARSYPVTETRDALAEAPAAETPEPDDTPDEGLLAYLSDHASEISEEAEKPFQPIGGFYDDFVPGADEFAPGAEEQPTETAVEPETTAAPVPEKAAAPKRTAAVKKSFLGAGHERGSALQKIAKLDIKGRIQLAMKGNKEERSLLIRDGTKVVALAVLESPKLSDSEVERFASQKNVLEAVLRGIPMKRRFVKHYGIVRNLVFNPRTPLDVSLGLVKHLLTQDLRHLSGNKEVSETVRKLATKMFKQKLSANKKD